MEIAIWPFNIRNCMREPERMRSGKYYDNFTGEADYNFHGYGGPNSAWSWTELIEEDDENLLSVLGPSDAVSFSGHCAPGLAFMGSPNYRETTRPSDLVALLDIYGFSFQASVCVRGCNTAVGGAPQYALQKDVLQMDRSFCQQLLAALNQRNGGFGGHVFGAVGVIPYGEWPPPTSSYFRQV